MTTPTLDQPARALVNAGHALTTSLLAELSTTDREKFDLFEASGAGLAITVKWHAGTVELRIGIVPEDSEPITVLALDFARQDVLHH